MFNVNSAYEKIIKEFDSELGLLRVEIDDILERSEKSIQFCIDTIDKIKSGVLEKEFPDEKTEIHFFKNVKPQFVSRLIFHINVYNIETHRPNGSVKIKRKYLQKELNKLKHFFDDNLDFYRYYRTGSTYLDHKYFIRGRNDIRLQLDSHVYESDPAFSTSHDFKISNILANDLLQVYLENELTRLDFQASGKKSELVPKNMLRWTGSKVSLVELLYALHATKSFNSGNADIKTIAAYLQKIFDIDLGEYYRTYLELRYRNNPTRFMDELKDQLLQRMEEDEEK